MDESTTAVTQPCLFFDLPQEIRDEIYSLSHPAYLSSPVLRNSYPLYSALGRASEHRKSAFADMMVCKQWYRESLDEWTRLRTISCNLTALATLCRNSEGDSALWKASVRSLLVDFEPCEYHEKQETQTFAGPELESLLPSFPHLRTLKIRVGENVFFECRAGTLRSAAPKAPLLPQESDFASIPGMPRLVKAVKGVENLEILSTELVLHYFNLEREVRWRAQVPHLEQWVRDQVSILREIERARKTGIVIVRGG